MLAVLFALLAGFIGAQPASAATTQNPGGKSNYVVTLSKLEAGYGTSWVRLGNYAFDSARGTVTSSTYVWKQGVLGLRTNSGTVSVGCEGTPVCQVRTAPGFTEAPSENRVGRFTNDGKTVHIVWPNGDWEDWTVTPAPSGTYARLNWKASNYSTRGTGYGSNASFETRRAMTTIVSQGAKLPYRGTTWYDGNISQFNQVFDTSIYKVSTKASWVMSFRQETSKACKAPAGGSTAINYYVARVSTKDRRDTWDHWCQTLADQRGETCYTGNSHTKPLLQIIDDRGVFQGWVGAEVFYDQSSGRNVNHGYFSTFTIAPSF